MSFCIQDWLNDITWMQQGAIFASIRGCDGVPKEDASKVVIRGLRSVVLKPAQRTGSFLGKIPTRTKLHEAAEHLISDLDHYPVHFLLHLIHAAEIIGYEHPEYVIGEFWLQFYFQLCHAMHMNYETKKQMKTRLTDDQELILEESNG